MAAERLEHGLRDRSDADLHRRAIRDEPGDVPADRALDVADRRRGIRRERLVYVDPAVDLAPVQTGIAERARHRWIHLRDHERGAARGRERDADRDAEAQ